MAVIVKGEHYIFGVKKALPLRGFPEGRARVRMRSNSWAVVFVKTKHGIKQYYVREVGGVWIPGILAAVNETRRNHA